MEELNQGLKFLNSLTMWDGRKGFSLEPMMRLMKALGNPQDKIKSIHVAGTNGKGSTSLMIAAALGGTGYRVGLTISPHLERINERFVIDGVSVTNEWINLYALQVRNVSEVNHLVISYHEALTAIAFVGFYDSNVDFMVVETGLGGRLDASNVISKPQACVITSIGLDHQEILGDTVEKIAREKAGIIKTGVPIVVGEVGDACCSIISSKATDLESPCYILGKDFTRDPKIQSQDLSLKGEHQVSNANLALKVLQLLNLSDKQSIQAFKTCHWPGRLEKYTFDGKEILMDCAHNAHGTTALARYLNQNTIKNINLIYGTLETKDWDNSLKLLKPFICSFAYFAPDSTRSLSQNTMKEFAERELKQSIPKSYFDKNYDYFINYISKLEDNYLILLTGSIYLVGMLRSKLNVPNKPFWSVQSHS